MHELTDLLGDTVVQAALQRFSCSRNEDVEQFLHKQAMRFEAAHKSRTYLLINKSSFEANPAEFELYGYFTLSIADLFLQESLSKRKKKDLHGLFYPREDKLFGFLIGQLGKNDLYAATSFVEGTFLRVAIETLLQNVQPWIGGRFVLVECKRESALINYYLKNGFTLITDDPDDPLIQLVFMLQ